VKASFEDSLLTSDGWLSGAALQSELIQCERSGRASRRLWYAWVLEEWLRAERADVNACGEAPDLIRSA